MATRRTWRIGSAEIGFRKELEEGEIAYPIRSFGEDRLRDPFSRISLSQIYRLLPGAISSGDMTNAGIAREVLRSVNAAFERGELVAIRRLAEGAGGSKDQSASGNGSSTSQGNKKAAPPPSDPVSEKTWVDVKLVDEDGEPVSGARYKLKITDGSMREGTLDASGRVRVSNIDPGTCTVWFPDYDGSEWSRLS